MARFIGSTPVRSTLGRCRTGLITALLILASLVAPIEFAEAHDIYGTYSYTGAVQFWQVPPGVNAVQVDLDGAQGYGSGSPSGGLGGHIHAVLRVTPGETLEINVGGQNGYNGGGAGTGALFSGGGASDIRQGGSSLINRTLVAGGGGASGQSGDLGPGGSGGAGGNTRGEDGIEQPFGGRGGSQTAGGAGGQRSGIYALNGNSGALGVGGASVGESGGGGGGYYGGGSGGTQDADESSGATTGQFGGGGGSSYADPTATEVTYTRGYRAGNGFVKLAEAEGYAPDPFIGTNGNSGRSSLSSGASYIAFDSAASNLVPNDQNQRRDVFVRSKSDAHTSLISANPGVPSNGDSSAPDISRDGRYVAFESFATNLYTSESSTNSVSDIFLHDSSTGVIEKISLSSQEHEGNAGSYLPSVSADGRYVAFHSAATNLVTTDTNAKDDVFLRDRTLGTTSRISVSSQGAQGNGHSSHADLDDSGRLITYQSLATNLVANDSNGVSDVFVRKEGQGSGTTRVSLTGTATQGNGRATEAAISGNGRYISFTSEATNLDPLDTNTTPDVYVRDGLDLTTRVVSVASSGTIGNEKSGSSAISDDGQYIVFMSLASNLIPSDNNGVSDIFEHNRAQLTTALISRDDARGIGNGGSTLPSISPDGYYSGFDSHASNFDGRYAGLLYDLNYLVDVYIHRWEDTPLSSSSFSALSAQSGSETESSCVASSSTLTPKTKPDRKPHPNTVSVMSEPAGSPHVRCVVNLASQTSQESDSRHEPVLGDDCLSGPVGNVDFPVNMSTAGLSQTDLDVLTEYVVRTNSWLWRYGPVRIQPTAGALRTAADAAKEAERARALAAGEPYTGQVGHVPDTAITGRADPPCGWLDMPGTINQKAGGVLGSRIDQWLSHFTLDGQIP